MTRVEFHPYSRVPGRSLAEVDIVLKAGALVGIAALRRAFFARDVLDFEAEWPERKVVMPRMRVTQIVIRANGNVWHRLTEVRP